MADDKKKPEQAAEQKKRGFLMPIKILPRFDAKSPEFNPILGIKEAIEDANGAIKNKLNHGFFNVDEELNNLQGLANVLQEIILPEVENAIKSKPLADIPEDNSIHAANIITRNIQDYITQINRVFSYYDQFIPYINEELKNPKYNGATLEQLRKQYTDENDKPIKNSPLDLLLTAVEQRLDGKNGASINIVKPTHYTIPNGRPVNAYLAIQDYLTHLENDGQITFLPITSDKNGVNLKIKEATKKTPEVLDFVSLTYSGDMDGKAAKIKAFDQSIYNGVASLVNAGNRTFLLEDLYKVVTQKTKPTQKQLDKFENSLRKFAGTRIRLDVTQELEAGLLTEDGELITQGIIEGALLEYRAYIIVTDKGTKKTAIELNKPPVLYEYSRLKDQIINIPINLLEVNGKATEETIAIRDYLLHEINQLKKGYRNNSIINYDALLKHINFDFEEYEKNRTAKSRITDTVMSLLDGWKSKGWIIDHKAKKTGRTASKIVGFEIITD